MDSLSFEIVRLARPIAFRDERDLTDQIMAELIVGVLPSALRNIGRHEFHEDEIGTEEQAMAILEASITGIMARAPDIFIPCHTNRREKAVFRLRKSKRGRRPTGEWRTCAHCGFPFWIRRSFTQNGRGRYCSHECLATDPAWRVAVGKRAPVRTKATPPDEDRSAFWSAPLGAAG